METSQDMTRIIFVQMSAVFWNSHNLVSKSNVKYCQLYKYEHMSFCHTVSHVHFQVALCTFPDVR